MNTPQDFCDIEHCCLHRPRHHNNSSTARARPAGREQKRTNHAEHQHGRTHSPHRTAQATLPTKKQRRRRARDCSNRDDVDRQSSSAPSRRHSRPHHQYAFLFTNKKNYSDARTRHQHKMATPRLPLSPVMPRTTPRKADNPARKSAKAGGRRTSFSYASVRSLCKKIVPTSKSTQKAAKEIKTLSNTTAPSRGSSKGSNVFKQVPKLTVLGHLNEPKDHGETSKQQRQRPYKIVDLPKGTLQQLTAEFVPPVQRIRGGARFDYDLVEPIIKEVDVTSSTSSMHNSQMNLQEILTAWPSDCDTCRRFSALFSQHRKRFKHHRGRLFAKDQLAGAHHDCCADPLLQSGHGRKPVLSKIVLNFQLGPVLECEHRNSSNMQLRRDGRTPASESSLPGNTDEDTRRRRKKLFNTLRKLRRSIKPRKKSVTSGEDTSPAFNSSDTAVRRHRRRRRYTHHNKDKRKHCKKLY